MRELIDLSHRLHTGMPVFPGSESPLIKTISSIESTGYNEMKLCFSSHTGTHLDVSSHLLAEGLSITDIPIENFCGKAFVFKCSEKMEFSVSMLNQKIEKYGVPDFILLHTTWDKYWGTNSYFEGFPLPSDSFFEEIAGLNLKGIGIDAISIDPVENMELRNHHILFNSGMIIIENLTQLDKLPETVFNFYCFPLRIEGADGSPVRAVAQLL